ncbi:TrmB family transcriptional regulator [Haloplanus aerogenes]|uniref:Transcriptional regulator TrmB n=1 Tax=Haloplanus aerogenes TaxID=660522 RepID=A0A3M0DSH0_9EURY|nr:helix-turn-helix domain-containing protein [Haloplanus aerogenes]AZH25358.1 TrmB family transcriptional regulator [Haloplanus aerogenes]RMB25059.1 transcriptional regulator TrmB [Haloplanus aerogenes]
MNTDPTQDPQSAAVEQLEQFGLSSYAARTFVALAGLGTGTARDVSQVSEVPRTRVYDAIDELHDRGLVDVQQSSPKEFWAISAETASRSFEHELQHRTDILQTALTELEPVERRDTQRGVWTVDGQTAVTERILEFFDSADEEIVYMTVEELLTDDLIDALGDAAERGISIKLGGVSAEVQERIQDEIPSATMFESLWAWSDTPAGRIMMIDGQKTLVSALVNGVDESQSDPRSETAIWGEGETNSLVAVLKAIFTWRLDTVDSDS